MSSNSGGSLKALFWSIPAAGMGWFAAVAMPQMAPGNGFSEWMTKIVQNGSGSSSHKSNDGGFTEDELALDEDAPAFSEEPLEGPKPAERKSEKSRNSPSPNQKKMRLEAKAEETNHDSTVEPLTRRPGSQKNNFDAKVQADDWANSPKEPKNSDSTVGLEKPARTEKSSLNSLPSSAAPMPSSSWQTVVKRLSEQGGSDYRLEPGSQAGSVLFVCRIAADSGGVVVHRFEAEKDDPATAAEDVLKQIDRWRRREQTARR